MKYISSFVITTLIIISAFTRISFAEEIPASNVNLTVVVPSAQEPEEEPEPIIPKLYPVNVHEYSDGGLYQVIKTYELSEEELPEDISREGFERNGILYELTDVIKKETSSTDVREHTKTVSIDTDTNDIDTIINLLAPTVEYKSDDGYGGILELDIKSISIGTAGTQKNTFTMTANREYPHLSSNDTSLVPKTINEGGTTYTLSGIEWRVQTSSAVDYQELPSTYTAIASYTATGSKTVVTGYTVTADYKGTIVKMIAGKTVYTAIFEGSEILEEPALDEAESEESVEFLEISETDETETIEGGEDDVKTDFLIPIIISLILGILFIIACILYFNSRKPKTLKGEGIYERYLK